MLIIEIFVFWTIIFAIENMVLILRAKIVEIIGIDTYWISFSPMILYGRQ